MEKMEWRFVDKSEWGEGEWLNEPDKLQWTDEATGLPCLIHRGPSGALCGYVGVDANHPWFQVGYSDPFDKSVSEDNKWDAERPECRIDVHGGLTFSDMCHGQAENGRGICHVPSEGEPDHVWWFGFDCAHSGDWCPAYEHKYGWNEGGYRDLAYVKREVERLARQLAAVAD